MADEEIAFTDAPSEGDSRRLTELGRELVWQDQQISRLEADLEAHRRRRDEIAHREMPDYMREIGQDRIGLMELGLDLVLAPYYRANIAVGWDQDRRDAAFGWLEAHGHGALIRSTLSVEADRGSLEALRSAIPHIRAVLSEAGIEAEINLHRSVPHTTLTAFVREQVEAGREVDLERLGAQVGSVVKIKRRK